MGEGPAREKLAWDWASWSRPDVIAATAIEGLRLRVLPRGRPVTVLTRGRKPGEVNRGSADVLLLLGLRNSVLPLPPSVIDPIASSTLPPPAFDGFLLNSCDLGDRSRGFEETVRPRRRVSGDAPSCRFAEFPRPGRVSCRLNPCPEGASALVLRDGPVELGVSTARFGRSAAVELSSPWLGLCGIEESSPLASSLLEGRR
jgi:hypothetical protein